MLIPMLRVYSSVLGSSLQHNGPKLYYKHQLCEYGPIGLNRSDKRVGRKNGGKKNKILKVGGVLNLNDFRASLKNIIIFFCPVIF
jgi:hypothetical protein